MNASRITNLLNNLDEDEVALGNLSDIDHDQNPDLDATDYQMVEDFKAQP